jgi:type IV/VI secretion system ImpK/VasF family protein
MPSDEGALTRAVEPLFRAFVCLERRRAARHDAEKLYGECCEEIEAFRTCGRDVDRTDLELALYAWIASVDEFAVNHESALKEYWQPRLLQVRFLGENVAGEGFFTRLNDLRNRPLRVQILRVYYTCLLFGFRGKYRFAGSQLELLEITESIRHELERANALPRELLLSPNGRRPYEAVAVAHTQRMWIGMATTATIVSLLLYAGLARRWRPDSHAEYMVDRRPDLSIGSM